MSTAKRVREEREAKRLSLRELAEKTSFTHTTIGALEKGETKNISLTLIEEISKALNVSPVYLMGWTGDKYYTINGDNNVQVNDNHGTIENVGYITYHNNTIEETNPATANLDNIIEGQLTNEEGLKVVAKLLSEILETNKAILEELKRR